MRLELICRNRVGILKEVSSIFVEHNIDLVGIEVHQPGHVFINTPNVDFTELQKIMPQLRLIDAVDDVKTVPFMPSEREKNEFETLLRSFPDPFISISAKGQIRMLNNLSSSMMGNSSSNLIGEQVNSILKGFNFNKWLDGNEVLAQTIRLKLQNEDFVADLMPIHVSEFENDNVLAGAIIILKSERRLGQQISALKQIDDNNFSGIQATSGSMRKVIREAKRMALLDSSILISGETGTGKELLAHACHEASERAANPFMTLSCAALPDDVAETELFGLGHQDKSSSKKGLFESANGGTIFLDEVGEMSPKLQTKLLRVIQDGSFRRVDDEQEIKVNVRIIGSTNKDLLQMVSQGLFREDLYYRLNVLGLNIPSLRERRSDIIPLAEYFIAKSGLKIGKTNVSMSDDCREFIEYYPWPGNVRQLESVLIRAVSLMEGNVITTEYIDLPAYTREHGYLEQDFEGTLDLAVKKYEADLLRKLYPAYPSTRQLAKKLGLSHTAIANKLREYDINKKTVKI
ncbi:transcriptional regulator TyrR [Colwellia sp. UCD-KL20]|uniref:transcriptional regulator TyrR n=1 Tax=Colwellia sp. UCD-KL20 TaxID=1917165 RepID=UPI000970E380|nr:transcriptional regulator TyrR [Colwellia sp. UCD-KL20]